MSIQSEDKKDDFPLEDEVKTPNFFNWRDVYPELEVLYQNQHIIRKEINNIEKVILYFSFIFYFFMVLYFLNCLLYLSCSGFPGQKIISEIIQMQPIIEIGQYSLSFTLFLLLIHRNHNGCHQRALFAQKLLIFSKQFLHCELHYLVNLVLIRRFFKNFLFFKI